MHLDSSLWNMTSTTTTLLAWDIAVPLLKKYIYLNVYLAIALYETHVSE